jgi:hypothetical protein
MSTQTSQETGWRGYDDRDAHQDRIATELASETDDGDW